MSNLPVGPTSPGAFEAPVPRPTTGIDAAAFETVGQTVRHAAGALEGLRDILERLEGSIARAVDHRQTEEQFGHLFLRAQAFVDASIAEAHEHARRVVADSEREASRIVSAAREEAARILEEGHRPSRMPDLSGAPAPDHGRTLRRGESRAPPRVDGPGPAPDRPSAGAAAPIPQSALSPQFLAPAPEISRDSLTAQSGQQPGARVSPIVLRRLLGHASPCRGLDLASGADEPTRLRSSHGALEA